MPECANNCTKQNTKEKINAKWQKGRYKIMTIKLQNTSIINAEGNKTNRNCRAVFCITTNTFYASVAETAKAIGVTSGAISWVLTKRMKTVKGLRFCYADEIMEHMEEIAETNRLNAEKARAYDEMLEKQSKQRLVKESVDRHKSRIEEIQHEICIEEHQHEARMEELNKELIAERELRDEALKELEALI